MVTGGAGFIGSHLVEKLVERGEKVSVLDNLSSGTLRNLAHLRRTRRVGFTKCDILDKEGLREAVKKAEAVVHLAALTSVPASVRDPALAHKINVVGTENVLRTSFACGVTKFVFASTCAVYGEAKYLPIDEAHPLDPLSPYARSKLKGEALCQRYQERFSNGVTVLRFFNVYGPRQEMSHYPSVVTKFVERLSAGRRPVIYGDGRQTRDLVHVSDVSNAVIGSLEKGGEAAGVFNIGSGRATSVIELAEKLARLFALDKFEFVHAKKRSGDIERSEANIAKAGSVLRFRPTVELDAGLREMIR